MAQEFVTQAHVHMRPLNQFQGTSQTVNRLKSLYSRMPICGCSVVNGYGAILGRAREIAVRSVRLPCVGISHQANLGENAELEEEVPFLTGFPRLSKPWGLTGGGCKVPVS